VQNDAPITELIANPFDDQLPIVRYMPGYLELFAHIRDQIVSRPLVENRPHRIRYRRHTVSVRGGSGCGDLAHARPDRATQLDRSTERVPGPKR